jgi:hemolysin activation/secretion protein
MSGGRAGLRSCVLAGLATTALSTPLASWAQAPPATPQASPPGTTAPELNPASRLPRPARRPSADVFAAEPPGPCPLATSDAQVTLSSVTFNGATAVTPDELRASYAEYVGKTQPVAILCTIRDRAARILFDKGILARVEIPEQRIAGGAFSLEVIEAHVVNVRVRGDIGPAQAAVERYVEKLRGMKPFEMDRAQRYLLLASDIPGVTMRAAVRPSTSGERGAVDIDVSVTRDPIDALANVQNLGSKVVGRWGGLFRGELDSATPYGEATALTVFHTLFSNEQWLVQFTEAARFGSEGLVARGALVYGVSHPGESLKILDLKSESFVGNLELGYPVLRSRLSNLNVSGGFDWIDQTTDILGNTFNKDQLRIVYARADGDLLAEAFNRRFQMTGGVTLRKGISGLGASDEGSFLLTRANAKPDAFLVRATGSAETYVAAGFNGTLRVQAQYSGSPLVPFEQLTLGNLSVGRGYDPAAVIGDSGVAGSFELRYGAIPLHPLVSVAPYGFFDAGYVHNNKAAFSGLERGRTLRSIGAGVVFRLANRANLELTYAHPLDATAAGVGRKDDRLLVQLTASLK